MAWKWALLASLVAMPGVAQAQQWDTPRTDGAQAEVVAPSGDTSEAAAERLRQRTGRELARAPLPSEAWALDFELQVVTDQRNGIDLTGIHVLQGFGVGFIAVGGALCIVSAFIGLAIGIGGGDGGLFIAEACGITLGSGIVIGATMLGAAETSDDLHRRRELDARIRRLRESIALGGTGLVVRF